MSISNIESLREQRAAAYKGMQDVLARTDDDGNLKSEDAAEFDARERDFDSLTETIRRMEKVEGLAPKINVQHVTAEEAREVEQAIEARRVGTDSNEYRDALEQYVRYGKSEVNQEERAALQVGNDGEGGYTVADAWARQLIESARDFGTIESLATVFATSDSGDVHVPALNARATAALTAEEAGFTESEDTFTEVVFGSYKVGVIMKVSDELLHDSIFDIAGFMARSAGEAIGIKANAYFATGTGTNEPKGVVPASGLGKTAAGASAITANELIDLYHSLLTPYRRNAAWLMKDSTAQLIRKLVDGSSQYLWQPGLQAGQPDVLLGRPVYIDPDMPAATTGLKSVLFGDFSKYWVRTVGGVSVKRLEELYAANGQVGFRVDRRVDGDVIDSAAIKHLIQA